LVIVNKDENVEFFPDVVMLVLFRLIEFSSIPEELDELKYTTLVPL